MPLHSRIGFERLYPLQEMNGTTEGSVHATPERCHHVCSEAFAIRNRQKSALLQIIWAPFRQEETAEAADNRSIDGMEGE